MKKFSLALGLLLGLSSTALAQSNSTVALTAGSGVNIFARSYASTNKIFGHTLCDPTTEGQCAAVDSSGQLKIIQGTASSLNATVVGTGTFATQAAQSGTWTVQPGNTANSTAWLVTGTGGTFPITNAALGLAQGSTTSGQTGVLQLGAVTTGAPSYTTAQSSPLSLDTAGNLRVNVVTGGTSGTVAQGSTTSGQSGMMIQGAVTTSAPTYTTAQTNPFSLTTGGALRGDLTTIAGTAPDVNSGNKGNGTLRVAIATDQPALTNAQPGNFTQIGGVAVSVGTGAQGTGSQRVAVATDTATIAGSAPGTAGTASSNVVTVQGIAAMTKLLVTPDSVALPANQSVNVSQINGVTPLMGAGNTGTGSQRQTIATDQAALAAWGHVAVAAAPPSGATYMGVLGSGATGGHVAAPIMCDKHFFAHITSATDTLAVQGVTSQAVYICSWRSRAAGVATWFLENTNDTNANCAGSKTQITGVATEAANTGETWGGAFWSGLKNTAGNGLCINSTGTGGVDVDIWYAQF